MNLFVFRSQGAQNPAQRIFTNWQDLVDAMQGVRGRKVIEFDDSDAGGANVDCVIPPGVYDMTDASWAGFGPRAGTARTTVVLVEGVRFTNLRIIGGQLNIINQATTTPPISDFKPDDQVHIGLRDDAGNTELINEGPAPMFKIDAANVFIFAQNTLLGRRSKHPLIEYTSVEGRLIVNLLGQNQTGNNLVKAEPGARVLFGALSSAAQIGHDQSSITSNGGIVSFGPVGRIQRQVRPLPPEPPAASQESFSLPNVLLRCDGRRPGFTQTLPRIKGGFTMGANGEVGLYSGGQEVVVAEVLGGAHLHTRAAPGDTIDGFTGSVAIGGFETRTFVSDGHSDWITTNVGRASLGSARVIGMTAIFETADETDAGTGGAVYLGIGGREFHCDTAANDFQQGATDTFVFGQFSNVLVPDLNDPTLPPLILSQVDRFPVYVRFDQGSHSPWRFRRLTVTLTVVPDPQPPLYTSEVHHPGGMWLGSTSGAMVFLVRDSQV